VSLYKRCACENWRCAHPWWYRFKINGRNYRATTQTALKRQALDIEASERRRILEGRHGIRRQPDIRFREYAAHYLDASAGDKTASSDRRDREIVVVLNRYFGDVLLHELTALRIEQFKRERLAGKWRAYRQQRPARPVRPGTVNRELDTLRAILQWAVKERKLLESPMADVEHLHVENRRIRVLTTDEQRALLAACRRHLKLAVLLELLLITGARVGEFLALMWADDHRDELHFLQTKNRQVRPVQVSPRMRALLDALPRQGAYVFTNRRTGRPYLNVRKVFDRALVRAGITTGDVTVHTLRHTAITRMRMAGIDDATIMELVGHLTKRMLDRYTHPPIERKRTALETFDRLMDPPATTRPVLAKEHTASTPATIVEDVDQELADLLRKTGGRREARTRDLRVANAALSQLS
jgi:integrase